MKKYIILILALLLNMNTVFAKAHSEQRLEAGLPEVLHIEKVIVEGVEYDKDAELKNVQIRSVEQISEECYRLSLSPFSIRINTNLKEPIQVSAKFDDCCSTCGRYPLKHEDLSVTPSSYVINNPYDQIETDFFTPQVMAHDHTVCTTYRAKLMISLGRV